jgi:hypothetical protein
MKQPQILFLVLLMIGLTQVDLAQVGSPTNTDSSSQPKQEKPSADKEKQAQKAQAKSTKPPVKAQTGKKTTQSQDNAYALAARKGTPDHENVPPK